MFELCLSRDRQSEFFRHRNNREIFGVKKAIPGAKRINLSLTMPMS